MCLTRTVMSWAALLLPIRSLNKCNYFCVCVCLCVCMSVGVLLCVCLCVYMSVCLSVCLCMCVHICAMYIYESFIHFTYRICLTVKFVDGVRRLDLRRMEQKVCV